MAIANSLKWKKYHPLTDQNAFICLVDVMGDDSAIIQAARVSYGKDEQKSPTSHEENQELVNTKEKDRQLIRYLMNHDHSTPFEMVTMKFMVQVPMDCWRQWIRHRAVSVNEYSTRYMEALDFFQVTDPSEWRLQSTDNKQGSSGFITKWPDYEEDAYRSAGINEAMEFGIEPGQYLTDREQDLHIYCKNIYKERISLGVAKEQARKDLPLSTYTRAYWQCNLRNIFHFLRLRMDSHAQLEIRSFANSMFEIIKQLCPVACEAFEDYVLHAKKFSRMEMEIVQELIGYSRLKEYPKPASMTDREWKEFLKKLS